MRTSRTRKPNPRQGTALIELAICLPVFVLLVIGTVELNDAIFKRQTLTSAAHEGALLGTRIGTTESQIKERVETILEARGIEDYVVRATTDGVPIEDLPEGAIFRVNVRTNNGSDYFGLSYIEVELAAQKP
jgi:UDP-galactopyranose mutase